ncbi:MAG: ABC transporter permease [Rhodothermia bacterium]|nr:MAG: ABC transporter permease [Rhodothermia bacterium]
MFFSYLKIALRSLRRNAAYSSINILGLTIGFVASFFILLWVQDELSYDDFYEGSEDVYRVLRTSYYGEGQVFTWPAITFMLDDVLDEDYPEIEYVSIVSWEQYMSFRRNNVTFRERGFHVGPDFFRILPTDFQAGNQVSAMDAPDALVVTESMAKKYFPEYYDESVSVEEAGARVVGEQLRLNNDIDLVITGVVSDTPANTSFRYDYVLNQEEFVRRNDWVNEWGNNGLRMIARLTPGADYEVVSDKIEQIINDRTEGSNDVLFLQPLKDIYLKSRFENGALVGGRIEYVRIFSIVALFILLIAAINFMNLATARSAQRALEVGIRKTFGSTRIHLARQFLGESVLTAGVALVIAMAAVYFLLPAFNGLTGKSIEFSSAGGSIWLRFALLAGITGVVAGIYPAFYLSALSVIRVIRKGIRGSHKGVALRRGLVVFQFTLSIMLIVGAVTVYQQINYIRTKSLGLDRQDVFYSRLEGPMQQQYNTYRTRLLLNPAIESVSASWTNPLSVGSSTGGFEYDAKDPEDRTLYYVLPAEFDFIETMKMEMAEGRDFSREFGADSENVIINEAAALTMNVENPIGTNVQIWGRDGQVIGIVKDFTMGSFYDPIEPTVMMLDTENNFLTFVRPAPGKTEEALAAFEGIFKEFNPLFPYEYDFLDETFEENYRSEIIIGNLALWFMILAIFIACLGLFGLSSFTAERRTREIGIRKVLGASVPDVVVLLSREFVALVIAAFVIAAPVSWYVMDLWLGKFEFRTELGLGVFVLAAGMIIVIAYATVSYQSIRAALANPADSLRSD